MKKVFLALAICAAISGPALPQATTPAVNSPLLSMAGGTAPSTIFVSTVSSTINTTGDISCFGTGVGPGRTIGANQAYIGNTYRILCRGVYTTPLANTSTVTAKIKWGATTIVSVTTGALPASATNFPFQVDVICTVRSIGASGSIVCNGGMSYVAALAGLSFLFNSLDTPTAVTIDTTGSSLLDATASWSAVTTQTASGISGALEILY